jgi:hypothetical protein
MNTLIPGVRPLSSKVGMHKIETPSGGVGNDLVGSGTMRGASQVVSHNGAGPVHPATAMPIGARPARFDFMARKPTMSYIKWLDRCASIAMGAEWCIDSGYKRWKEWYRKGFTPNEAVTCLFELVRQGKS